MTPRDLWVDIGMIVYDRLNDDSNTRSPNATIYFQVLHSSMQTRNSQKFNFHSSTPWTVKDISCNVSNEQMENQGFPCHKLYNTEIW